MTGSTATLAIGLVTLAGLVACGPDGSPDVAMGKPRWATNTDVPAAVSDGTGSGMLVVGAEASALAYGGRRSDGTAESVGALIGPDGVLASFETPVGLDQPSGVVLGTTVVLAGKACAGPVEVTDVAVHCDPGNVVAYTIDLTTGTVTNINLGLAEPAKDANVYANVFEVDGRAVVQAVEDAVPSLRLVATDGTVTELTAPATVVRCATGTDLIADTTSYPAPPPERSVITSIEPPPDVELTLSRLSPDGDGWTPIATNGALVGTLGCTSAAVLVAAPGSGLQRIDADGVVTTLDVPIGFVDVLHTNPHAEAFAITSGPTTTSYVVVDLNSGQTVRADPPSPPFETSWQAFVLDDGRLAFLRDGTIDVAS